MKVAIQGIQGSFHDQAAKELFSDRDYELVECTTFRDVFTSVQEGQTDYGVVAVENSLYGSINAVYKLLAERKLYISGETSLHVSLYVIAASELDIAKINTPNTDVFSQREALGQCQLWLSSHLANAKIVETDDTAKAVQLITERNEGQNLAIAGKAAAELYDAKIIAGPINDELENYTRFFVITKKKVDVPGANRTSIILHENTFDKPGILYKALVVFAEAGINLSKLDSHPRPGKIRSYAFYIDFDASLTSPEGQKAIETLENQGWRIQILGSYKAHAPDV